MLAHILPVTTLQRYILWETLRSFLLCASFLLSLLLLGRGINMLDLMVNLNLSLLDFALVLVFITPMLLLLIIPLSVMLSTFLTFLRMSTDRELVALRAGGVSVLQMLSGPIFFAVLCCGATTFVSLYGISWGTENFRSTIMELAKSKARLNMQPGIFNQDIENLTLYARTVSPDGDLTNVIFEDQSDQKDGNRTTILAPSGRILTDEAKGELIFYLEDGRIYKIAQGNVSILDFGEYILRFSLATLFKSEALKSITPKEMPWEMLLDEHEKNKKITKKTRYAYRVEIEMHKRWALPVACIVLTIFAIPLACCFENARKQVGVALAMVAFLLYYVLYSLGISLSESGKVPVPPAMWFANAFFLLVAIVGMYLALNERAPDFSGIFGKIRLIGRKKNDPA